MDSLAPNLFVKDMAATIAFYKQLGFQLIMSVPDDAEANGGKDLVWAMMVCGQVTMMFQTFQSLGETLPQISRKDGGSLLLYINLRKIHEFYEKIKDKVQVVAGLNKTFYGATEFSILDNNNYVLTFAEHEQR
ncbi:MAG: VOC family protein [Bacteroidota bacterium]|nr:VOC family protein [Bacteroidota bacterium]MDP4217531.1 VOC family protein [Bacteroidota bacterium]MDP4248042.1 VOC family protein [Bacteroidota bacterium]MDP4253479.1 VOC family protein [Bacteroidota bacterium]MDP4259440.1 VOC family protein [Bacteroidota bacterium]